MKRPAVFLDRDGVLLEERGYVTRPEELRLLPGAAAAVRSLRGSAYAVVLVTNQSAVARGFLSRAELETLHAQLQRRWQMTHDYLQHAQDTMGRKE